MRRNTLVSALFVMFFISLSLALGIPTIAKDESSKEPKVLRLGVEDPQKVSGSRTDRGDVDYWALIIGVSEYIYPEYNLEYCDDDARDIYSALITYQGWNPDHIVLLLDSEATWDNVIYHLSMLSTNVDSNDVFLLTFSGHGDYYPDDDGDESDGYDELLVLHDWYGFWDDDLEYYLGWFDTDKIMVFLDSCFSGGFIESTSFREEDLVSRSLPGTQPVKLEDSFSRDLDKAGFVVLTACDFDEVCWESSSLENGIFTYFFVEGIESGFPADSNMNGYISAEEAFSYARPLTTEYVDGWAGNYYQHPQIYDGVLGELEFTAPYISINIDPSDIDFGTIYEGGLGTSSVTITNDGNVEASIEASLESEVPVGFYTSNLKIFEFGPGYVDGGYVDVGEWNLVLPSKYEESVLLELTIPHPCPAEDKTAILVFWAVEK